MSKNSSSDLSNSFRELLSSMFPQIEAFIEANSIINRNDDSIVKLTKSQQAEIMSFSLKIILMFQACDLLQ